MLVPLDASCYGNCVHRQIYSYFVAMDAAAWYQSIAMETPGRYQSNVMLQLLSKHSRPLFVTYWILKILVIYTHTNLDNSSVIGFFLCYLMEGIKYSKIKAQKLI